MHGPLTALSLTACIANTLWRWATAFWSYTHEDDKHEDGAIVRLAERTGEEYSLLTGERLTVFVDRNDLAWGEHWKQRIDDALVSTTLFIPVITTRYFASEECRRELFRFARHDSADGNARVTAES